MNAAHTTAASFDYDLVRYRAGLLRLGEATGRHDVGRRMIHVGDLLVVVSDGYATQKRHKYLATWNDDLTAYIARDLGDPDGQLGWFLNEPQLAEFRVINSVVTGWLRKRHL